MNKERVAVLVRELLTELGEDPNREGCSKHPSGWLMPWRFSPRAIE